MQPLAELARFADAFSDLVSQLAGAMDALVSAMVEAPGIPRALPQADVSTRIELGWAQWLEEVARPELVRLRGHVELSLSMLHERDPVEAALRELVRVVDALPDTIELVATPSPASGDSPTTSVPLRRYMQLALLPSAERSAATLRAEVARLLRDRSRRIGEIEKVLDHYTLAVQRHGAELEEPAEVEALARTGRQRIDVLFDELEASRERRGSRARAEFLRRVGGAFEDACGPFHAHRPDDVVHKLELLERAQRTGSRRSSLLRRTEAAVTSAYRHAWPLGRRLALELRLLFSEHAPEATTRSYPHVLSGGPSHLGADLPPGYRRLFSAGPIEVADAYVHRVRAESAIRVAIDAWREGMPQAVLLHGDRGAGKRTLVNHVLAEIGSAVPMRWVRLGRRARDEATVAATLARALGLRGDVADLPALASLRAKGQPKQIVVVENADRVLSPTPEGVARLASLLRFVGETAPSTLWILLMASPAADLAFHRLDLGHRVPTVVGLDPMTPHELKALVLGRHRLSGFQLDVASPETHLVDYLRNPVRGWRAAREPLDVFVTRLSRLTGGNPRQALYLWLASAAVHAQHEGKIVMRSLPASSTDLLARIRLSQRLVLALLAQYSVLSEAELRALLTATPAGVAGDLQVLRSRGLVSTSGDAELHYSLHPTLAHPVIIELRASNML